MHDDAPLLRQYTREGSEQAFRALVERHLPLVNATARRITNGNVHLAQDVTQLVFTDLARKAGSLPEGTVLGGWLHRHTCYTALKALRTETRRRTRERIAMELTTLNENSGHEAHWLQLAPVLDEALNCLSDDDRNAIVLRYFQQQDVRTVGEALGTTESAAQKRLGRALEKLRGLISRRGVAVASSAALATTLEASPIAVAVPGLAASISAQALSTAAATTLTFASFQTMLTSKLALSLAAAAAAGVLATVLVTQKGTGSSPAPAIAQVSATKKSAASIIIPATTSQVAAPKLPPAVPHDADPAAPVASDVVSTRLNVMTAPGSGALVFTNGTGGGPNGGGTLSFSGNRAQATMVTAASFTPTQFNDNGDGTISITQSDGTTKIVPKSPLPVNMLDNGDGTLTITLPDGTTNTVTTGAPAGSGAVIINAGGSSGSGTVIINTSP